NRRRFLRGDAVFAQVVPSGPGISDAQGEMSRTDTVCFVLEQQVQVLIAEVEPDDDEIERARLVDLLEPEDVAVKPAAALDVGDDDGTVVDLSDLHGGH